MKNSLVIYTDNGPGQNKNVGMMALWLNLVRERVFKSIDHIHLPYDRDSSKIEKHTNFNTHKSFVLIPGYT
jgi:hypothetical protein